MIDYDFATPTADDAGNVTVFYVLTNGDTESKVFKPGSTLKQIQAYGDSLCQAAQDKIDNSTAIQQSLLDEILEAQSDSNSI